MSQHVKVIGANGQLSLGKEFAGKMVLIEQIEKGTWLIKSGAFVPDAERWLNKPDVLESLGKALDWAEKNKPQDNFSALAKKMSKGH